MDPLPVDQAPTQVFSSVASKATLSPAPRPDLSAAVAGLLAAVTLLTVGVIGSLGVGFAVVTGKNAALQQEQSRTQEALERLREEDLDNYNAARVLIGCVSAAGKDGGLPPAERARFASAYSDLAVAALRTAIAKGYKDVDRLRRDRALGPLRGHDGFQKLLSAALAGGSP
jgi:hypothetical protein